MILSFINIHKVIANVNEWKIMFDPSIGTLQKTKGKILMDIFILQKFCISHLSYSNEKFETC